MASAFVLKQLLLAIVNQSPQVTVLVTSGQEGEVNQAQHEGGVPKDLRFRQSHIPLVRRNLSMCRCGGKQHREGDYLSMTTTNTRIRAARKLAIKEFD
jgi:hypothetical protein